MSLEIYVTLAIAIVGLILWAACTPATTLRIAAAKLGDVMLWAGLFAFCFALATKVLKL